MRLIKIILMLSLMLFSSFSLVDLTGLISVYAQDWPEEARQFYEKGKDYYEQGKYKEAEEEFQKAFPLISQQKKKPTEEVMPEKKEVKVKKKVAVKKEALVEEEAMQVPRVLEYVITEGDVLYISVWQEPDLKQEAIVRPDGKISFPLVGDIYAAGLTFDQLNKELTQRLRDYIRYPIVSILLRRSAGKKIIVLGQVRSPGVYSVTGRSSVLEAVALAGGFTSHAVVSSVILIRGGFQNPKGSRLNLTRAIDKGDFGQNVILHPEDILYVPKKFIANVNYFVTQIVGPIQQSTQTKLDVQEAGD